MKGFRTLLFSGAISLIGVLEAFNFTEMFGTEWYSGVLVMLIGIGVAYLRNLTDTAIGKAE